MVVSLSLQAELEALHARLDNDLKARKARMLAQFDKDLKAAQAALVKDLDATLLALGNSSVGAELPRGIPMGIGAHGGSSG